MNRVWIALTACLALAVLLPLAGGGCPNLKPTADPVRYFVLRPIAEAGETRGETSEGLRLGIAPGAVLPTMGGVEPSCSVLPM